MDFALSLTLDALELVNHSASGRNLASSSQMGNLVSVG
jgi:hypothetical protein